VTPSVRSTISSVVGIGQLPTGPSGRRVRAARWRASGREVDLDRDVDTTGPSRQRRLEQVGPGCGEHEQQVGVGRGSVHRVEEVKQNRARAGPEAAILGNQIDVLEHQDGRLQVTRELRHGADCLQRPSR